MRTKRACLIGTSGGRQKAVGYRLQAADWDGGFRGLVFSHEGKRSGKDLRFFE